MENVVKALNPNIEAFDTSCFSGCYITGDIDEAYLQRLSAGKSSAAAAQVQPSQVEHSIRISDNDDEEE